jgi:hypothetical protein
MFPLFAFACPPTSIPDRADERGHFFASPYMGIPHEHEPTRVAPRSTPSLEISLPLWDLGASLAVAESQLALDEPPAGASWIAWALPHATDEANTHEHLIDALASPELAAEHLAWWRSHYPNSVLVLRAALDRSSSAHTRALLTTALALEELERSCPVAPDIDGACRAPGTQLLLRRSTIALERAREWIELAHKRWSKLDVDAADLATRALRAELELAIHTTEYEALLDEGPPDDLWLFVDEWRHDSGVPAWEAEYRRQLARVDESNARSNMFFRSSTDCASTQLEVHGRVMWIDARNSGVALLRSARMLIAAATALDAVGDASSTITPELEARVCSRQSDPVWAQAASYLERCIELANVTLDAELDAACHATLWKLDRYGEAPLAEFVLEPRASTTMHRNGVVGPLAP